MAVSQTILYLLLTIAMRALFFSPFFLPTTTTSVSALAIPLTDRPASVRDTTYYKPSSAPAPGARGRDLRIINVEGLVDCDEDYYHHAEYLHLDDATTPLSSAASQILIPSSSDAQDEQPPVIHLSNPNDAVQVITPAVPQSPEPSGPLSFITFWLFGFEMGSTSNAIRALDLLHNTDSRL